jgi:hypothetical protein
VILGRRGELPVGQLIEVIKIQAYELAPEDQSIDPYVIVFDKDQQILRTALASGLRAAQWSGFKSTDKGGDQPRIFHDGQPLFFEFWDDNTISDTLVGGFVMYPDGRGAAAVKSGDSVPEARMSSEVTSGMAKGEPQCCPHAAAAGDFYDRASQEDRSGSRRGSPEPPVEASAGQVKSYEGEPRFRRGSR